MAILDSQDYSPEHAYTDRTSQSWTTTGNTHTVTNAHVKADSIIALNFTSAGGSVFYVTPAAGSFVITSENSVASGTTFTYKIL